MFKKIINAIKERIENAIINAQAKFEERGILLKSFLVNITSIFITVGLLMVARYTDFSFALLAFAAIVFNDITFSLRKKYEPN